MGKKSSFDDKIMSNKNLIIIKLIFTYVSSERNLLLKTKNYKIKNSLD